MKKELGMVGWPTKTLAINTIDLPPRDGRKVEGREAADRGKNRDGEEKQGLSVDNRVWLLSSLSIVLLCFLKQRQSNAEFQDVIYSYPYSQKSIFFLK